VWLRELELAPTGPALTLVASVSDERRCAHCRRRLAKAKRVDAITCSKSCRQKRARAKTLVSSKVSRRAVVARHVLSDSARARATPFPDAVPSHVPTETPSKRVTSIGRVRGVEAHIV
jgi:hypothetical protein